MGKSATARNLVSSMYAELHDYMGTWCSFTMPYDHEIALSLDPHGGGAYTYPVGEDSKKRRIVIGSGFIKQAAMLPDRFPTKEKLEEYIDPTESALLGAFFHELGHNLFTDMSDPIIKDYPKPEYRNFLHTLNNINEDPAEEEQISLLFETEYPADVAVGSDPRAFFKFLKKQMFVPLAAEYKDDGGVDAFLNYILLLFRVGKSKIKEENKIFVKYSKDLVPKLKAIFMEPSGSKRLHMNVALGEWMIENIKELDFKAVEPPKTDDIVDGKFAPSPGGGGEGPIIAKGPSVPDKGPSLGDDEDPEDDKDGEGGKEKDKDDGPLKVPPVHVDHVSEECFDDFFKEGGHEWKICKNEYQVTDPVLYDKIDKILEEGTDLSYECSKFLNIFHDRIRPRIQEGFKRGKLNVRRAMKDDLKDGCDTKIFNQKVAMGNDPDLCVSLLCDNSGSMGGTKSKLCTRAALLLAQACDWSHIPFECNAFTKTDDSCDGICITLKMKSFEDDFQDVKQYFGITDSDLIYYLDSKVDIPTFCGNSEEVNLYYIWQQFRKVDHKTKVIFVMCDGMTTGSSANLKKVINDMTEDGIVVIGLGIQEDEVQNIYPISKIFNSMEELEGLGEYLIDTLGQYAKN